ncbi:MAG: hypothetical protein CMM52_05315 [Rhodospirillaceae bacterium]|nr:hypothetical protein [Rhodospirillaceae bacterium]|tara:strand:+ start:41166 stop:42428 length:1263 start_codon:yes stop_codon:yes gene_type:complete
MLKQLPREPVWVSWLYVALCAATIFATVPFGRLLTDYINEYFDDWIFIALVVVVFVLTIAAIVRFLILNRGATFWSYFWLAVISIIFCSYAYSLRDNAVETLHFIEYGLLGVLIYRALSHRVRDLSIYPATLCIGFVIGVLDEGIQWMTPQRVWDMRDIALNSTAVVLTQAGIGLGLKPAIISVSFSAKGVVLLCRVLALAVFSFGVCLLNTPNVIDRYVDLLPGGAEIRKKSSQMAEYGFLYKDPEIGVFRSRFDPKSLKEQDQTQSSRAAKVLDQYPDVPLYPDFFEKYTVINDRFIHEAGVHLFRREKYLDRFLDFLEDNVRGAKFDRAAHLAWRETRILEKYYGKTLGLSRYDIPPKRRAMLDAAQNPKRSYESPVSKALITGLTYGQVAWGTAFLIILLLGGSYLYSRRINDKAA